MKKPEGYKPIIEGVIGEPRTLEPRTKHEFNCVAWAKHVQNCKARLAHIAADIIRDFILWGLSLIIVCIALAFRETEIGLYLSLWGMFCYGYTTWLLWENWGRNK